MTSQQTDLPPDLVQCAKCGEPEMRVDDDPRFGCLSCVDAAAFAVNAGWSTAEAEGIDRVTHATAYAGIGSRRTPAHMLELMTRIASALARRGWVLRSGAAAGADQAFAAGARDADGALELFLPWPRFQGTAHARLERPTPAALELATRHHPTWPRLSASARALLARNGHQVLGAELDAPAHVLICWTPDGSLTGHSLRAGGTGQALRIAAHAGVPVVNLAHPAHEAFARTFLTRT